MSNFKSEFLNIMPERGFTTNAPTKAVSTNICTIASKKGVPAVGYLGSDPTGDSLHVGHIVP